MNRVLLYINDSLVDLYPNTVIATTFQNINIGDIKEKRVDFTNRFKAPFTPNNNVIFGNSKNIQSGSEIPYLKLPCRLIQNGIQIKRDLIAVVEVVDGNYQITIFSKGKDFFSTLESLGLVNSLDFGIYNAWNNSYINSKRLISSNDIICPVIDYGKLNLVKLIDQVLINAEMDTSIGGWENAVDSSATEWVYDSGNNDIRVDVPATSVSTILSNKTYNFFALYKYTVTFNFEVTGTTTNVIVSFGVTNDPADPAFFDAFAFGDTVTYNSNGTKSISIEVESRRNWNTVAIIVRNLDSSSVVVAGLNVTITPNPEIDIKLLQDVAYSYFPSWKYKYVVEKVIEQCGYTLDISNFNTTQTDHIESLIIPFSKDKYSYSDFFLEGLRVEANSDGTQLIDFNSGIVSRVVDFSNAVKVDSFGYWDGVNQYITPLLSYRFQLMCVCRVVVEVTNLGVGETVSFVLSRVGGNQTATISANGTYSIQFETGSSGSSFNLLTGSKVHGDTGGEATQLTAFNDSAGNADIQILYGTIKIFSTETPHNTTDAINLSYLSLPDISAKDLIRDFSVRTGSYIDVSDGVVKFLPIENIINNKYNSVDVTNKRVKRPDKIIFSDSYAQVNKFSDSLRDGQELVEMGELLVENENLDPEKDYYDSGFYAINDRIVNGVLMATMDLMDVDSELEQEPSFGGIRQPSDNNSGGISLLQVFEPDGSEPDVKYNGTIRTDYCIARYLPGASWPYALENYYPSFQESIRKYKAVDRDFILNESEIIMIDEKKIIFDTDSYFLVNKIPKFIPNRVTEKVELLRIF